MENPLEVLSELTDEQIRLLVRVMHLNEESELMSLIDAIIDWNEKTKIELIETLLTEKAKRISFGDLPLIDQINLIYLCEVSPFHDTTTVAATDEYTYTIVERLVTLGALTVFTRSMRDAYGLLFDVRTEIPQNQIAKINNDCYFTQEFSCDELLSLYKQFLCRDLLAAFRTMLQERALNLVITQDAYSQFYQIIGWVSYRQILHLCKRVSIDYTDKVKTGKFTPKYAGEVVLDAVHWYYCRAIANQWILYEAPIYHLQQETVFYIERVLGCSTDILSDIPNEENFIKWHKSKNENSYKWQPISLR